MCDISLIFCVFNQKTAYEMRISDWSSDVCSSDLPDEPRLPVRVVGDGHAGAVLPALAEHLVHRQHSFEQLPAPVLVEPVVLAGGAREVPRVHEDVVGDRKSVV